MISGRLAIENPTMMYPNYVDEKNPDALSMGNFLFLISKSNFIAYSSMTLHEFYEYPGYW